MENNGKQWSLKAPQKMIQRAGLCGDLAGGISLESAEVPFWRSFGMWETKWKKSDRNWKTRKDPIKRIQ